ncbi:MAG: T9SS type A sorting domain-containing protein [Bacteroidia bacterium]|nr:T9SS type A sorting domain-containing protein [Bacteroidia bacterium]
MAGVADKIIKLYDISGKLLLNNIFYDNHRSCIKLAYLKPGLYLYRIMTDDKLLEVNKFIEF